MVLLSNLNHFCFRYTCIISQESHKKMGGTPVIMQGFQQLLLNPERGFRILKRFGWLMIRMRIPFLKNYNAREQYTGLPQPAYYNSPKDSSIQRLILSNFWLQDMNILHSTTGPFTKLYNNFDYDEITKTFYPTKNNAMQSVNMATMWNCSWWNPANYGKFDLYRKSDTLFADMIVNTQGVYKAKKVIKGSAMHDKVKRLFEETLTQHRSHFGPKHQNGSLIDSLIEAENLFWVDYPELRDLENNQALRKKIGGEKYTVKLTTSTSKSVYKGYLQIPFGLFSVLPNYVPEQKESFVCIGSTFNDSPQVYHPFDNNDQAARDKWELAKSHFASTDNNDFIIRVHLGHLHYASAIYTTALCNLSKHKSDLAWFKTGFIDQFSYGLLQINFLANLTLVDRVDPIAEKTIYLRAAQSLPLLQESNSKFNIMQFNPDYLGKDSYESASVQLSRRYYEKLSFYIDYLFEKNKQSWQGKTEELGKFIYDQLRNGNDKFDAIPESICHDKTPESLKRILKSLAYLWLIHHGETFSIISVVNMYYLCPTFHRKPLRDFKNQPMTDLEKQDWLAPQQVINDSMILSKQVTFRRDMETIISQWGQNNIDNKEWNQLRRKKLEERRLKKAELGLTITEDDEYKYQDYDQFWNDVSIEANRISLQRSDQGLFYLHWLMPNEMPNALNI